MHHTAHPRARSTVTVDLGRGPRPFEVEDWWDRVYGKSWMFSVGNPACLAYAIRSAGRVPLDDEVVYGKTEDDLGHLVHISEIREEA